MPFVEQPVRRERPNSAARRSVSSIHFAVRHDRGVRCTMSDILTVSQIKAPGTATSKDEAIREAGGILVDAGAIPHGTNEAKDAIKASALSVVRYDTPIDWDGNEVRFAVGIAGLNNGHLEILGKIAVVFSDMDEVDKMIAATSAEEIFEVLNAVNEE
jgi:mannitol PTS system EIIA component